MAWFWPASGEQKPCPETTLGFARARLRGFNESDFLVIILWAKFVCYVGTQRCPRELLVHGSGLCAACLLVGLSTKRGHQVAQDSITTRQPALLRRSCVWWDANCLRSASGEKDLYTRRRCAHCALLTEMQIIFSAGPSKSGQTRTRVQYPVTKTTTKSDELCERLYANTIPQIRCILTLLPDAN